MRSRRSDRCNCRRSSPRIGRTSRRSRCRIACRIHRTSNRLASRCRKSPRSCRCKLRDRLRKCPGSNPRSSCSRNDLCPRRRTSNCPALVGRNNLRSFRSRPYRSKRCKHRRNSSLVDSNRVRTNSHSAKLRHIDSDNLRRKDRYMLRTNRDSSRRTRCIVHRIDTQWEQSCRRNRHNYYCKPRGRTGTHRNSNRR